jgi:hypothetical protein
MLLYTRIGKKKALSKPMPNAEGSLNGRYVTKARQITGLFYYL